MRRSGVRLMAAFCVVVAWAVPLGSSWASVEEGSGSQAEEVRAGQGAVAMANGTTSMGFWVWSSGRRGYFLADATADKGAETLVSVDLDTLSETARVKLPRRSWSGGEGWILGAMGRPHTVEVDEAGGRLFVAYDAGIDVGIEPCATARLASCVGGLLVIDAATLQTTSVIPLARVRAEGVIAAPFLRAMAYSPPRGEGDAAKVHMLVEDAAADLIVPDVSPRYRLGRPMYLIQFDPDSGRMDWMLRVDSCRNTRENPESSLYGQQARLPQAGTILRSRHEADPAIYVGCHAPGSVGQIVRVPLDGRGDPYALPVTADMAASEPVLPPAGARSAPVAGAPPQEVYVGPDLAMKFIADPAGGKILMQSMAQAAEVWWTFDTARREYTGTIGIGKYATGVSAAGFDSANGRLYVLGPATSANPGGLFIADTRRVPLPQALSFPSVATGPQIGSVLIVERRGEGEPTRVWYRDARGVSFLEDRVPVAESVATTTSDGRTLDLDETEGVTSSAFDGAARGYGARVLLMQGVEGATRANIVDPLGTAYTLQEAPLGWQAHNGTKELGGRFGLPAWSSCLDKNAEITLAFTGPGGPAVLDATGARGSAEPVLLDSGTAADVERPASRCLPLDWEATWQTALFGRPPVGEPTLPWSLTSGDTECVSGSDKEQAQFADPVSGRFAARVDCGDGEASGWSVARAVNMGDLGIGEALSSFRVYRDPARGIVSRIESTTRGVSIDGVLRIAMVRASAESWANGRKQPVAEAERDAGYTPNCDFERTAGTCFRRQLFGVWTPGWSCGPCGDEAAFVNGMNRALGNNGRVRLRDPDPVLAGGSENGFIAAVQKADYERFADLVLNTDLLQTVLPTLEILRYAPAGRISPTAMTHTVGNRGRQVIQLAGVGVSSSYGIQCLLVYDEATNTCAGEKQTPGAIHVSLADPDGKALAGGAFEVRADVDADGVLGLKDTLLPDGACVTTDDGVGTCTFEGLQPGGYLVNQVAAPPGYAKSAEPFVVELASGEQRTVAFTNVSNLSTVELKATDEHGAPVSGAVFAAYPDPDSDGKVAPDAKPAAECTTDAQGACSMKVPAGSYVLVQTSAPAGLEGIEPVAFTFASGGQVAAVTVVNYPPEQPAAPEGSAAPAPSIGYSPPVDAMPPTEIVGDYLAPDMAEAPETAQPPVLAQIGDTITQVIRAPGDALRLLARDPKEAVAWTAALALFCLAVMAIRRRQQAMALIQQ